MAIKSINNNGGGGSDACARMSHGVYFYCLCMNSRSPRIPSRMPFPQSASPYNQSQLCLCRRMLSAFKQANEHKSIFEVVFPLSS